MQEPAKIENKIRKALKDQQTYTKVLDMNITICAYSYCVMSAAFKELDDDGITIIEKTREDNDKHLANPAARIFFDAQEAVRKALRELGLTFQTLASSDEDEVTDLINEVEKLDGNSGK